MSSIGSGGPQPWEIALWAAAGKGDESKVRDLIGEGRHSTFGEKFKEVLNQAFRKAAGEIPLSLWALCAALE